MFPSAGGAVRGAVLKKSRWDRGAASGRRETRPERRNPPTAHYTERHPECQDNADGGLASCDARAALSKVALAPKLMVRCPALPMPLCERRAGIAYNKDILPGSKPRDTPHPGLRPVPRRKKSDSLDRFSSSTLKGRGTNHPRVYLWPALTPYPLSQCWERGPSPQLVRLAPLRLRVEGERRSSESPPPPTRGGAKRRGEGYRRPAFQILPFIDARQLHPSSP